MPGMTDTHSIPGGAHPGEPTGLVYRSMYEDGTLQGVLWASTRPTPGGVNGGAVTHLDAMPARLAWLGQGLAHLTASGAVDATEALDEFAGMGGTRWRVERETRTAPTLLDLRLALAEATAPAAQAVDALAASAAEAAPQVPADEKPKRPSGAQRRKAAAAAATDTTTEGATA